MIDIEKTTNTNRFIDVFQDKMTVAITTLKKNRCRTKPFKGSENCNEFGTLFGFRTNKVSYQTIFYNREKGFRR